jgi:hypothetical protein
MCTLNVKTEHCQIADKLLHTLLDGHWKRFDQRIIGVKETYPPEQNAYFAVNLVGALNAWPDGNVNGVAWR